jgi:hypothetical protein
MCSLLLSYTFYPHITPFPSTSLSSFSLHVYLCFIWHIKNALEVTPFVFVS